MPPLSPENNGYNIFATKACACLRALGSVMVMIVLGLILLTYYTTVFCVYGKLALGHGPKSGIATVVIVIYNLLVRARAGQPASGPVSDREPWPRTAARFRRTPARRRRCSCCCGATSPPC
jgi:hypothetical protein